MSKKPPSDVPHLKECGEDQLPNSYRCDNDSQYYFSAAAFTQVDENSRSFSERNELFEYGIDSQCSESGCGSKRELPKLEVKTKCYICGYPILHESGEWRKHPEGSQCEHVLTVSTIAMLCGLSNNDYTKLLDEMLDQYHLGENLILFKEFRELLIRKGNNKNPPAKSDEGGGNKGIVYKWSHPACNLIKNEYPFIIVKFTEKGPVMVYKPNREGESCDSLKYVLETLWMGTNKKETEWRKIFDTPEYQGDEFLPNTTGKAYCNEDAIKKIVAERVSKVNATVLQPIRNNLKNNQAKLSLFNAIAMHIMCEIIKKKLLDSSKFKVSSKGLVLNLQDTFKQVLLSGYERMSEPLKDYLQSRDKTPLRTVLKNSIVSVVDHFTPKLVAIQGGNGNSLVPRTKRRIESVDKLRFYKMLFLNTLNNYIHEYNITHNDIDKEYMDILSYQSSANKDIISIFAKQYSPEKPREKIVTSKVMKSKDKKEQKKLDQLYFYINTLYSVDQKMHTDLKEDSSEILDNPELYVTMDELDEVDKELGGLLLNNIASVENGIKIQYLKGSLKKKKKRTTRKFRNKRSKQTSKKKKKTKKKKKK